MISSEEKTASRPDQSGLHKGQRMPKTITFAVQGSAPAPYRVTFERDHAQLRAFCTCAAGQNGQYCKHRAGLLLGIIDSVVTGNLEDLRLLGEWLRESPLACGLQELDAAELALEQAKRRVTSARKAVSSLMLGNKKGSD